MQYEFTEIFDIPLLTRICESYTRSTNTVTALLDLEGKVYIATGWQDMCTKFHRVNPDTAQRCIESDTVLAGQLSQGMKYNAYKCKNGLVDVAVPVILEGDHVGNFFTGQFFSEKPKPIHFISQAKEFGFDESSYLEAMNKVPVFSEDEVKKTMEFLVELTQLIGEMGLERLRKMRAEKEARRDLEKLVSERTAELNVTVDKLNSALEESQKLREEFELQAIQDPLTGLYNRRFMDDFINREIKRANRANYNIGFIFFDVDNFKVINDRLGHDVGDLVLSEVCKMIKDIIREEDVFCRYGGDEFLLVLSDLTLEETRNKAEEIRALISQREWNNLNESLEKITLSLGVSSYPVHGQSESDLLKLADNALLRAKESGRNQVFVS